jgi:predicted transcriptional regulator
MVPNGYNLTSGGEMAYTVSEQTKQKMSKVRMGIKLSDETKKKMSDYHKGRPKEHLKGRIPWNKGKTHSPETKEKLRQLAIKQHQKKHK